MIKTVLKGYESDAVPLIPKYEAIDCDDLYAPVQAYFPSQPANILDIGAGTGRDAAWLADKGHHVLALEPVQAFRVAGAKLHPHRQITWIDDCLPNLTNVIALQQAFEGVLISGVWQHLSNFDRETAFAQLSKILLPLGFVILSLRHGPGAANRPVTPCSPEATIGWAEAAGFRLQCRQETASMQPQNQRLGVTWTWLVFEKHL